MSPSPDNAERDDDSATAAGSPAPPPLASRITIDRFPDGLTIQLPAAGFNAARGMFAFALLWDGAMAVITLFIAFAIFGGKQQPPNAAWGAVVVLSLFWASGIGLLLASLNMARRRAAFAVTSGTLMVIQTGLFGSKQRDFEPGDVEAIRLGPSGITVNNKPVRELQIFDGGAAKFGLLAGRSDEELDWLAAELRQALHVPTHAS